MTAARQPPGPQEGTGPDRIWLEPDCCADPSTGSLWCQDNVWVGTCEDGVPATEYIRADVAARQVAEAIAAERERCAKIAENPGFIQAQDTEWDMGVEYAKPFIARAIRSGREP